MAYDVGKQVGSYDQKETMGVIEKIAKQVITSVTADDRLSELEKGTLENGTTLEQVVVGLAGPGVYTDTYDGTDATDPFKALDPNLVVRYFDEWTSRQYSAKVSNQKFRKIMLSGGSAGQIAEMVVASLMEGENQTNYETVRNMFKRDSDVTAVMPVAKQVIEADQLSNPANVEKKVKEILLAIRNAVSGMTFVNTTYNGAGIKRKTNKEDIMVIMPYEFYNLVDVEVLAGIFNIDKLEVQNRVILIDAPISGDFDICIFDKNAVQIYTRLKELTSEFNAKTLEQNYFYTVEKMYAFSPLFDACKIAVNYGA